VPTVVQLAGRVDSALAPVALLRGGAASGPPLLVVRRRTRFTGSLDARGD
jgi:hypothetical protein